MPTKATTKKATTKKPATKKNVVKKTTPKTPIITPKARALTKKMQKFIEDAGAVAYPVQVGSVEHCLHTGLFGLDLVLCGGLRRGRMYTFLGMPSEGKCITGGSLVPTNRGLVPIKKLIDRNKSQGFQQADNITVASASGHQTARKTFYESSEKRIRITTGLGLIQEATPEHSVLTINKDGIYFKRHDELVAGQDYVAIPRGYNLWSEKTPSLTGFSFVKRTNSIKYKAPSTMTRDIAWICGALVAKGNLTQRDTGFSLTSTDYKVNRTFRNKLLKVFGYKAKTKDGGVHVSSIFIHQFLEYCGLKFTTAGKDIPWAILESPRKIVLAFLKGYLRCDGGTDSGNVLISSASAKLIKQMQIVLLNLGVVGRRANTWKSATNSKTPTVRKYHYLFIRGKEKERFLELFPKWHKKNLVTTNTQAVDKEKIPWVNHWLQEATQQVDFRKNGLVMLPSGKGVRMSLTLTPHNKRGDACTYDMLKAKGEKVISHFRQLNNPIAEDLQHILRTHYYWDKVETTKETVGSRLVYDLTATPRDPTFVANGILNHNSTLLQEIIAAAQCAKIMILHFDMEAGSSRKYMGKQGIIGPEDTETINGKEYYKYRLADGTKGYWYFQPETGDEAYQNLCNLLDMLPPVETDEHGNQVDGPPLILVVIDSYESMTSADVSVDQNPIGASARMHSRYQKIVRPKLRRVGACHVAANQIRMKPMAFGSPETDGGGLALQFYADGKIRVRRRKEKKEGNRYVSVVTMKVTKHKMADPFHEYEARLIIGRGFDKAHDRLKFLEMAGEIEVERGKYIIDGKKYAYGSARKLMFQADWKKYCRQLRRKQATYDWFFGDDENDE